MFSKKLILALVFIVLFNGLAVAQLTTYPKFIEELNAAGYEKLDINNPPLFEPMRSHKLVFVDGMITAEKVEPTETMYWKTDTGITLCASLYDKSLETPDMFGIIIHAVPSREANYSFAMAEVFNLTVFKGRFIVDTNDNIVIWSFYDPNPEDVKRYLTEAEQLIKLADDSSIALALKVSLENEKETGYLVDTVSDIVKDELNLQSQYNENKRIKQMNDYIAWIAQVTGGVVHVSNGSDRFHAAKCKFIIKDDDIELSLQAALNSGYTPCTRCLGMR